MDDREEKSFEQIARSLQGDLPDWPVRRSSWQTKAATALLVLCLVAVPVVASGPGASSVAMCLAGAGLALLWRHTARQKLASSPTRTESPRGGQGWTWGSITGRAEERWRKRRGEQS